MSSKVLLTLQINEDDQKWWCRQNFIRLSAMAQQNGSVFPASHGEDEHRLSHRSFLGSENCFGIE